MSSRNDDCARRACSELAVSSGRGRTSSGTTAVAASATPHGSSGLSRTLDVGNAAPARLLAPGEIGPHSRLARETVSLLALPDAPRGSVFTCFPLCAHNGSCIPLCAQTLRRNRAGGSNFCGNRKYYHISAQEFPKCGGEESAVPVRKGCAGGFSLFGLDTSVIQFNSCPVSYTHLTLPTKA